MCGGRDERQRGGEGRCAGRGEGSVILGERGDKERDDEWGSVRDGERERGKEWGMGEVWEGEREEGMRGNGGKERNKEERVKEEETKEKKGEYRKGEKSRYGTRGVSV